MHSLVPQIIIGWFFHLCSSVALTTRLFLQHWNCSLQQWNCPCGRHKPLVAVEHLKCGLRNWILNFILFIYLFIFFLVLPVYCYQPVTLHPHAHMLSHVTPWTAACQAPLSMDFSRQEYWSGLPFPSPPVFDFWQQPDDQNNEPGVTGGFTQRSWKEFQQCLGNGKLMV